MDHPIADATPSPMMGSNQTKVRNHNERLVLHLVRRRGALTKADATRETGLSPNAISTIVRGLERDGLLLRDDPVRGRIGQPSVPLRLNPAARFYLGLKIGRRSADMVVVDFCGAVRARRKCAHDYPTPDGIRRFVKDQLPQLLRSARVRRAQLSGSGIAMPTGLWEWLDEFDAAPADMAAWRTFDAERALGDILPRPILVENDGTAACRAEWTFGAEAGHPHAIYFFVGTFIGGGIVLNGSVFKGCHGNSGGFGPLRVPEESGGTRLIDHASLATLDGMLAAQGTPFDAAAAAGGDWAAFEPTVTDWITRAGRSLAHAIVSAAAVIDFRTVIIDGPFPDDVRTRLCHVVGAETMRLDLQGIVVPQIVAGSLGDVARAVGAAAAHVTDRYMVDNLMPHEDRPAAGAHGG